MSTWMYLVCPSHEAPVKSDGESGQHTYDVPQVRFDWLRRDHWLQYIDRFPDTLTRDYDHLSYFQRNTFAFLRDHRDCTEAPYIESEYGGRYFIEPTSIDELLTETATYSVGAA